MRFGISTLERWYYAARRSGDPVAALKNRLRDDVGRFPSLTPVVIDALTAQYREHPGWTVQLHVDNLRVVLAANQTPLPSYPTIRRYLLAQGMRRQTRPQRASEGALAARERLEQLEVRSFEVDHVSALWHLDVTPGVDRVFDEVGAHYDGPVTVTQDFTVFNVTRDAVVARQAKVNPAAPPVHGQSRTSPVLDPAPTPPTWWTDALLDL